MHSGVICRLCYAVVVVGWAVSIYSTSMAGFVCPFLKWDFHRFLNSISRIFFLNIKNSQQLFQYFSSQMREHGTSGVLPRICRTSKPCFYGLKLFIRAPIYYSVIKFCENEVNKLSVFFFCQCLFVSIKVGLRTEYYGTRCG